MIACNEKWREWKRNCERNGIWKREREWKEKWKKKRLKSYLLPLSFFFFSFCFFFCYILFCILFPFLFFFISREIKQWKVFFFFENGQTSARVRKRERKKRNLPIKGIFFLFQLIPFYFNFTLFLKFSREFPFFFFLISILIFFC